MDSNTDASDAVLLTLVLENAGSFEEDVVSNDILIVRASPEVRRMCDTLISDLLELCRKSQRNTQWDSESLLYRWDDSSSGTVARIVGRLSTAER